MEDNLENLNFVIKEPVNYRKAEKLDLNKISQHFQNEGYSVIDINQFWRHITGRLVKNGRGYFLKMASTSDIAQRTYNEAVWSQKINTILSKKTTDLPFHTPTILRATTYENHFYFLADYVEAKPLATKLSKDNSGNSDLLRERISDLVNISHSLLSLDKYIDTLPRDIKKTDIPRSANNITSYYEIAAKWYLPEVQDKVDLRGNLELIKELDESHITSLNHGDFTPWHILTDQENRLWLIDAEHASKLRPKFYDFAYCYHRIYTSIPSPDIADEYLALFKARLNNSELVEFENQFPKLLASRIIGGFYDAFNDQIEDWKYHFQLQNKFLNLIC